MKGISVNFEGLTYYIEDNEYSEIESKIFAAHDMLEQKTGAGRSMLGWQDIPINIKEEEIEKIKKCADKIRTQSEVLIVIGTGGSYLGSKICYLIRYIICKKIQLEKVHR